MSTRSKGSSRPFARFYRHTRMSPPRRKRAEIREKSAQSARDRPGAWMHPSRRCGRKSLSRTDHSKPRAARTSAPSVTRSPTFGGLVDGACANDGRVRARATCANFLFRMRPVRARPRDAAWRKPRRGFRFRRWRDANRQSPQPRGCGVVLWSVKHLLRCNVDRQMRDGPFI